LQRKTYSAPIRPIRSLRRYVQRPSRQGYRPPLLSRKSRRFPCTYSGRSGADRAWIGRSGPSCTAPPAILRWIGGSVASGFRSRCSRHQLTPGFPCLRCFWRVIAGGDTGASEWVVARVPSPGRRDIGGGRGKGWQRASKQAGSSQNCLDPDATSPR